MNGTCNCTYVLSPPPGALEKGQKDNYHLISIAKSMSNILKPNFLCLLTNKNTKDFRRDFYSVAWVMSQGWY